jgi:UDP-N-acetyl-D-mannosaminuronic acid transferase (WecB/TagA/CpsF family)
VVTPYAMPCPSGRVALARSPGMDKQEHQAAAEELVTNARQLLATAMGTDGDEAKIDDRSREFAVALATAYSGLAQVHATLAGAQP